MSSIPHASLTDVGMRREHNEDSVLVQLPVLVVADGVGGSAKGEVASRMAIETFASQAPTIVGAASSDDAVRAMEQAVLAANASVHESQLRDETRRGMATTITAAAVRNGGEVVVGHVGDSRLYVLSAAGARQVTEDHSVVAELVRTGRLDPQDAAHHPQRNVITRALGPEPDVTVDAYVVHVGPGDWLLACSDGLTEHVTDAELARTVVAHGSDPARAAKELVDLANARGGSDNITVALAQPVPSDVSGELRIEALHAAAATASIPAATPPAPSDAPAEDSGPLPAVAATSPSGAAAIESAAAGTGDELPELEPIPHEEDWVEPSTPRSVLRHPALVATVVVVAAFAVAALLWSQSYFVVERPDGFVGIDRGFPFAGLSVEHSTSDVPADDLDPADRERLVESERILSREDAEQVVEELPQQLAPAPAEGA
jgi:protein phosphatase